MRSSICPSTVSKATSLFRPPATFLSHDAGWQLIDADSALVKDVLRHGDSGHRVRPSCVKRKVRDDLGEFTRFHTVVQCQRKVKWHLDRLDTYDEGRNGDDASIPW